MSSSTFQNITIYGAGGDNIGKFILDALLNNGYTVSVLSRKSSKSTYSSSVNNLRVGDDLPHAELVKALRGQDVVISCVGHGPGGGLLSQYKIIDAAVEAGVQRFMPSEYGFDNGSEKSAALSPVFKIKNEVEKYLRQKTEENSSFSWSGAATSIWLEWALPLTILGIDPKNHTVAYWDDGNHKPSQTTLSYAAQGVIEILKHPEETKNKRVFMQALSVSQREIVTEFEKQQGVKYRELNPIDGAAAVRDAHARIEASRGDDEGAMLTTILAQVLMKEYGANFVESGKKPMLENFAKMPKVTLEDVVKSVISKQ